MSVAEVMDCLDAYNRNMQRRNQEQEDKMIILAAMLYHQAEQTANMIGAFTSKDVRVLPLSEYYPEFFERPDIQERRKQAELSQYVADMKAYADRHNQRFEQEGGESNGSRHDTGETEGDY
jgi:hypothetical protein